MNKLAQIPKFKTIAEEKAFWQQHDSADYIDWTQAKPVSFSKIQVTTSKALCKAVAVKKIYKISKSIKSKLTKSK